MGHTRNEHNNLVRNTQHLDRPVATAILFKISIKHELQDCVGFMWLWIRASGGLL
jgi:hypothetical protein